MSSDFYKNVVKRIFDVVISAGVLLLSAPLLIGIALAIRLDSPGPVLFRQNRTGKNGETFQICKFRSMSRKNNVYDMKVTDQVTRVGYWLRRTSLDELPQLLNVLRGEMSLIGPRPWIPDYYAVMCESQRRRYEVRPGITGLAQATGRNSLSIHEKIAWDLEYVDSISLATDIRIVFQTLKTIGDKSRIDIGKEGISAEIHELSKSNGIGRIPSFDDLTQEPNPRVVIAVTTDHAVQYHADLARKMRDSGWEVTFVSSGGPALDDLAEDVETMLIRMERNPSPMKDLRSLLQWVRLLRKISPDLVIAGTPKAGLLGVTSSWLLRVPVRVYWLHGLRLETAIGPLRIILAFLEKLTISLATETVAVSFSLRDRVQELKLATSDQLQVIGQGSTQGVNLSKFAPIGSEIEREESKTVWNLDSELPVIGFLGRLTSDKGVCELGQSLINLSEKGFKFQALLVGPIEDSAGQDVINFLQQNDIPCVAPGRIENTIDAYRAMDIFCLPSYREGLPNVVLEAFAMGLPVVATDITGCSDLITSGENGILVPPRNVDQLEVALALLLSSQDLRTKLGEAAKSTAQVDFDVEHVTNQQFKFFDALMEARNA